MGDDIKAEFGGKGSFGRYPGPDGDNLNVPLTGELEPIPEIYRSGSTVHSVDHKWIPERGEWVAAGLTEEPIAFDDSYEHASGPYRLDGQCIGEIRERYGVTPEQLSSEDLIRTSPEELEKLGKEANPNQRP